MCVGGGGGPHLHQKYMSGFEGFVFINVFEFTSGFHGEIYTFGRLNINESRDNFG